MLKYFKLLKTPLLLGALPVVDGKLEQAPTPKPVQTLPPSSRKELTGWDRLYLMYTVDEFGVLSPELINILQGVFLSVVVGAGLGGFVRSRNAFMNFMQFNQASQFQNHLDAKRKLQDQVTLGFARGAYQVAWRLGAFTGTYMFLTSTLSTYRGKNGILEHSFAGFTTGAAYKCSLGVRGLVVGGTLGLILGTMAGGLQLLILSVSGYTVDDIRQMQHNSRFQSAQFYRQAAQIKRDEETPALAFRHDDRVGELPLNLEPLEQPMKDEGPVPGVPI